ncbi:MAG TPA: NifB/NifX family molybdenum-iron cluster-binding protein [Desulfosporosinus sp.]|nr:NifB/NifX family molybdenum-iron cluster-binding protein [Desulfosporosinus sp.]
MIIAMPVDEQSMETTVCQSFGRTPYFLIYDTESMESVFLNNSGAASQGGAGIKAAQTIVDHKVSALLTPRCGENAAEVINATNIKMYKTINDSIKDNIDALNNGQLSLLDEIHPGLHDHAAI